MVGNPVSAIWNCTLCRSARNALVVVVAISGFAASGAIASESTSKNVGFLGVWAGERQPCAGPDLRLHVYRRKSIWHPVVLQDTPGYSCRILKTRGRSPDWVLSVSCILVGSTKPAKWVPATQSLRLSQDGRKLQMEFLAPSGDVLWAEEFHRCRSLPTASLRN